MISLNRVVPATPLHIRVSSPASSGTLRSKRSLAAVTACCALFTLFGCGGTTRKAANIVGTVSNTKNPQVAEYDVTLPVQAAVTVVFGPTTNYGFKTWTKSTPSGGGKVSILVAGMEIGQTYHMQALVNYADGSTATDVDHSFNVQGYSPANLPVVVATTTPGQTPQPGIEMVNPLASPVQLAAFNLAGKLIWSYDDPTISKNDASWLAPKLLENGDFIALVSPASSQVLPAPPTSNTPDLIREFDLAGNTVKQITMTQLNASLAAAGYDLTLQLFSHDITVLPNGHWIVLANQVKDVVLTGATTPTSVIGDAIIDLDTTMTPVWVWNEFDHLDVNRHPWNFPDWTHTNAVIYSPDDGNLLVSIRHQNWIVKVDYNNGAGSGDVLWHLGAGGDFKLINGTDPTDWSYAQHGISFTTPNSSGNFGLAVMDNGDDRVYPGQDPSMSATCGVNGAAACYTTASVFQLDETAKTATLQFHQKLPANLYSDFGGNALTLDNGDVEYDLCGILPANSQVYEVTPGEDPQTVWSLSFVNNLSYRSYRLPSLYPGVQW